MIEVNDVSKIYRIKQKLLVVLQNISFLIRKGEIVGLIGKSGAGKSTLGKLLLGFIPPTSGQISFRGNRMQMIFQDPSASLNPRMKVQDIIEEPLKIHQKTGSIDELLELVALSPNKKYRFPHELSGGEKQRVAIARALALKPDFLVCDEPVSSLDKITQMQIIELLTSLQKELSLTYLFISHDLQLVEKICTRVLKLEEGKLCPTE